MLWGMLARTKPKWGITTAFVHSASWTDMYSSIVCGAEVPSGSLWKSQSPFQMISLPVTICIHENTKGRRKLVWVLQDVCFTKSPTALTNICLQVFVSWAEGQFRSSTSCESGWYWWPSAGMRHKAMRYVCGVGWRDFWGKCHGTHGHGDMLRGDRLARGGWMILIPTSRR